MDDNTELIKLLNDFLVGIDMGTDTFRSYEEKLESEDLKNEFKNNVVISAESASCTLKLAQPTVLPKLFRSKTT